MAEKVEHISESDFLNDGREKINKFAIDPAIRAENNSENAKKDASEAKEKAGNVEDRLDNIIAGEMDDAEVIDARGNYDLLGNRLNDMPTKEDLPNVQVDDNIRIGATVSSGNQAEIDELKSEINQDLFNFVFISDVHYDKWSDNNKSGLNRLNNALTLDGSVDAIISGGDNVDGGAPLPEIFKSQTREYVNNLFFMHDNGSDKFILKGNHDDASGKLMSYYRSGILAEDGTIPIPTTSSELQEMYGNNLLINGEYRDGMSNYFYKDYPDKKIRLIGLDSNDIPDEIMNEDDRPKYYGIMHMGYQEQQLDWLANIALQNVPSDFTTVIVAHVQADATTSSDTVDDHFTDMYYNVNLMTQIVNDFKYGRSTTISGTIEDWEVSIQTDFTGQGPRTIAGFIHGHRHLELFTNSVGFNSIGITCSIDKDGNQVDGWNIVTVDTVNKRLVLKGFGRATDREYDY